MLRTIDTFSGIGGFSYGLERLCGGFETIAFCEQDKFCQKILRKHWPGVPIYDDIRTFPTSGLGTIDLLCGGFPCQPWSVAGKREGHEDSLNRDLWPEMARIIQELQPRWVIGENVRGFINEPMGLARTLTDLDSLGYQSTYWILPAASVGAPHRRDRVWIVAHANSHSEPDGTINEERLVGDTESDRRHWGAEQAGRKRTTGEPDQPGPGVRRKTCGSSADVAHANRQRGRGGNAQRQDAKNASQSPRNPGNNTEAVGPWDVEPEVGRVAHGIPNRVDRLKALGNAIVPQVVAQIGKAILSAEEWENSNETRGPEWKEQ